MRKIKRYVVDVSFFVKQMSDYRDIPTPHLKFEGIPPDAEVVGMQVDPHYLDRLYVFIASETFPEVPLYETPEEASLSCTVFMCETSYEYYRGHIESEKQEKDSYGIHNNSSTSSTGRCSGSGE